MSSSSANPDRIYSIMNHLVSCAALLMALLVATPSNAEPAGKKDSDKRAQVEARMKQVRSEILRKEVGLDASKATDIEKILDKSAAEKKKLQLELRTHRHAMRELLQADSNDQAAYTKAIRGLRGAQTKLHALRDRELDEISKQLSPKQQAKFVHALWQTEKKLRKALSDYREKQD